MESVNSRIWIVIVNYRTADLTINCLRSLSEQVNDLKYTQVVVVDNNSNDDSVEILAAAIKNRGWSTWASLMPLERNGGFAFGNNASIRLALAATDSFDYILLLNPDTSALPGAIKILVDFMNTHQKVGIAGSQLENPDGSVECSAHTFPSPIRELVRMARLGALNRLLSRHESLQQSHDKSYSCDWLSGASMIIRRQVIEEIGLMDEKFFLYFEEVRIPVDAPSK